MSDSSPKDMSEQGDDLFDFEEFSKYVPICVRRNILTQMVADFPESMKNRIKALKELQFESTKLEAEFYKEVFSLECKYQKLYNKLHDKRNDIVHGKHEPTPSESTFEICDPNIDEKLKAKLYEIAKQKLSITTTFTEDTKGIPDFWYQIFRNVYMLSELIEKHDEPVLKYLVDVKVEYTKDPMGFTLLFSFAPNKYFSNKVLVKEYHMKCVPSRESPFVFDGPEIINCKGCEINWYPEKNVTRIPKEKESCDDDICDEDEDRSNYLESFFNFFSPPQMPPEGQMGDEDTLRRLSYDYEIAHYIRERIIPHAVLFFTGEGIESDEDEDDEDDDDEDESDEDERDEDEDADSEELAGMMRRHLRCGPTNQCI